jgi:hypothetical protein
MDSSGESIDMIDNEGNLFGAINVVDAIVILLIVAVVVASAALVFGSTSSSSRDLDSTYVTLDMGTQPEYIVAAINGGDSYAPDTNSNLVIQDIYLAPEDGQTRVILRAELQGTSNGDSIEYAGAGPRLGRSLSITTDEYDVSGRIRDVGDDETLTTDTTTVVLQNTVSTAYASQIAPGDEIRRGGRTVATVEDVAVYATDNLDQRRVMVEADLNTYTQQRDRHFGSTRVQRGQSITLPADEYTVAGTITQVGSGLERESLTTRMVTLQLTEVREEYAGAIQSGMNETTDGTTVATITNVDREPSPIITSADDGSVVVSDHPTLRDVTITADLQVRETTTGIQFKGQRIQQGSVIFLDLGTVTVRASVVTLGQ